MEKIFAYKGFDENPCRERFRYELGKTYSIDDMTELVGGGFFAHDYPLGVFFCHFPCSSRYCLVELSGELQRRENYLIASQIRIVKELSFADIHEAMSHYLKSHVKEEAAIGEPYSIAACDCGEGYCTMSNTGCFSTVSNSGSRSVASNTGRFSMATNTGYRSNAVTLGDVSIASNIGPCSIAQSIGNYSVAKSSGARSGAHNTGHYSVAVNTGDCSVAVSTGDGSVALNAGDQSCALVFGFKSIAEVTGDHSVAMGIGRKNCIRAGKPGSVIFLVERDKEDHILSARCGIVGKDVKAGVTYELVDGEFVEMS